MKDKDFINQSIPKYLELIYPTQKRGTLFVLALYAIDVFSWAGEWLMNPRTCCIHDCLEVLTGQVPQRWEIQTMLTLLA
jgi:hypothetical protein